MEGFVKAESVADAAVVGVVFEFTDQPRVVGPCLMLEVSLLLFGDVSTLRGGEVAGSWMEIVREYFYREEFLWGWLRLLCLRCISLFIAILVTEWVVPCLTEALWPNSESLLVNVSLSS